jgi:hypothetical protein
MHSMYEGTVLEGTRLCGACGRFKPTDTHWGGGTQESCLDCQRETQPEQECANMLLYRQELKRVTEKRRKEWEAISARMTQWREREKQQIARTRAAAASHRRKKLAEIKSRQTLELEGIGSGNIS